jgi:hypothetical protein
MHLALPPDCSFGGGKAAVGPLQRIMDLGDLFGVGFIDLSSLKK